MCGSNTDWEDKRKKCSKKSSNPRRSALRRLCPSPYSLPSPGSVFCTGPLCSATFPCRSAELQGLSQGHPPMCLHSTLPPWSRGRCWPSQLVCLAGAPFTLSFSLSLPPALSLSFGKQSSPSIFLKISEA